MRSFIFPLLTLIFSFVFQASGQLILPDTLPPATFKADIQGTLETADELLKDIEKMSPEEQDLLKKITESVAKIHSQAEQVNSEDIPEEEKKVKQLINKQVLSKMSRQIGNSEDSSQLSDQQRQAQDLIEEEISSIEYVSEIADEDDNQEGWIGIIEDLGNIQKQEQQGDTQNSNGLLSIEEIESFGNITPMQIAEFNAEDTIIQNNEKNMQGLNRNEEQLSPIVFNSSESTIEQLGQELLEQLQKEPQDLDEVREQQGKQKELQNEIDKEIDRVVAKLENLDQSVQIQGEIIEDMNSKSLKRLQEAAEKGKDVSTEDQNSSTQKINALAQDLVKKSKNKKSSSTKQDNNSDREGMILKEIGLALIVVLAFLFLIFGSQMDLFFFMGSRKEQKSYLQHEDEESLKKLIS